ncbi:cation:proton antiporter domain-containing protein [Chlorobium limicola]
MIDQFFPQILLLLGIAVAVVIFFQKMHIPSSIGYLLVGVLLGPYTAGPVLDVQPIRDLAEFGIVFLLFTIGLNFSLPQIHALRHQVLGLGTAQVLLTTIAVGLLLFFFGQPPVVAFVVGAIFAQSSTTIISKQLAEQGEENTRHGRLGMAMSVFQDVTAVPFVVVIPVLAATTFSAGVLAASLGWAFAKATAAFALVFVIGRWALRPLFHLVSERRSAEIFTLTVLLVSLAAAGITSSLGLSMAFGAFLAGMMLGETEFRHQVESTIRPFRDVLVGLFFVGIGMLFDLSALPGIWHLALLGAFILMLFKTFLVAQIVRVAGIDFFTAWRTGWLMAVGGEFGFALLAIALDARALDSFTGQIVLSSVLFSMILAPFFIRYNSNLARLVTSGKAKLRTAEKQQLRTVEVPAETRDHVIICGYGRIGQSVAHFLEKEAIAYVALDMDSTRVKEAYLAGEPVYYGDASERDMLEAIGILSAKMVVISHEDVASALKTLHHIQVLRPGMPVMVRTRDESHLEELRQAGATEVVPETLEASLMISLHVLLLLNVPAARVMRCLQEQREGHYQLLREFFRGNALMSEGAFEYGSDLLHPVLLTQGCSAEGKQIGELDLKDVIITAIVRGGERQFSPSFDTILVQGDVLVLFGSPLALDQAEESLLG